MTAPIRPEAWSTAVPGWEALIEAGRPPLPCLPLNERVAERALRIFKRLRVPDLIGTPSYGEVCDGWVFDLVRVIFGSYDPETRRRALSEFFLLVPKKNGKSAVAAAIIVTAAILNERPQAELLLIAPTQQIASIVYKQARGIIALDDELAALFHVRAHLKTIVHRVTEAEIKILSADGDVITGSKATYVVIDETHVLAAKAKAPEIFLELRGGLASRPEGFLLQITTQSKSEPSGQFRKELQRARDVRDGKVQLPLLAMLYELPARLARHEGWRDEKTWSMVNPNLGRSVQADWLRDKLTEAELGGPEDLRLFASQHFNVEIGLGLRTDHWAGARHWEKNALPMTLEDLIEWSDVAVVGGDVGGADDLFSLTVLGRHAESQRWLAWTRAWCVTSVLDLRQDIAARLRDFEAQGDLRITEDAETHVIEAADICDQLREARLLPAENAIGLDPWGVAALEDELLARGFTTEQVVGVSQGWKLNGAVKGLERKLYDGRLAHADQALLTWAVGNAKAEQRGNNVFITKAAAGTAKIDPLIALFNAAVLMERNPEPAHRSYLEHAELMVL